MLSKDWRKRKGELRRGQRMRRKCLVHAFKLQLNCVDRMRGHVQCNDQSRGTVISSSRACRLPQVTIWASVERAPFMRCVVKVTLLDCAHGGLERAVKSAGFGGQTGFTSSPHTTPFHCGISAKLPNFWASVSSAEWTEGRQSQKAAVRKKRLEGPGQRV